jgi:hypothetical protein
MLARRANNMANQTDFDQIAFERHFHEEIVDEVDRILSNAFVSGMTQIECLEILQKMFESLHSITEQAKMKWVKKILKKGDSHERATTR